MLLVKGGRSRGRLARRGTSLGWTMSGLGEVARFIGELAWFAAWMGDLKHSMTCIPWTITTPRRTQKCNHIVINGSRERESYSD